MAVTGSVSRIYIINTFLLSGLRIGAAILLAASRCRIMSFIFETSTAAHRAKLAQLYSSPEPVPTTIFSIHHNKFRFVTFSIPSEQYDVKLPSNKYKVLLILQARYTDEFKTIANDKSAKT